MSAPHNRRHVRSSTRPIPRRKQASPTHTQLGTARPSAAESENGNAFDATEGDHD